MIPKEDFIELSQILNHGLYSFDMIKLLFWYEMSIRTKNVGYLNIKHELKYQETLLYIHRIFAVNLQDGGTILP